MDHIFTWYCIRCVHLRINDLDRPLIGWSQQLKASLILDLLDLDLMICISSLVIVHNSSHTLIHSASIHLWSNIMNHHTSSIQRVCTRSNDSQPTNPTGTMVSNHPPHQPMLVMCMLTGPSATSLNHHFYVFNYNFNSCSFVPCQSPSQCGKFKSLIDYRPLYIVLMTNPWL